MKNSIKKEIVSAVESSLPEALEGFGIRTSKQLVKNSNKLVNFLIECFDGEWENQDQKEVRTIVMSVVDNWKF